MPKKPNATNFVITGPRCSGKSTAFREILARVGQERIACFRTVPVEEAGERVGFALLAPTGSLSLFAHRDWTGPRRRGAWGYDPSVFDRLAPLIQRALSDYDGLAFDEIGFMEDEASAFRRSLARWLASAKPALLVLRDDPAACTVGWILRRTDVLVWRLPEQALPNVVDELSRLIRLHLLKTG